MPENPVSAERIVAAADALARRHGIDGVTIRLLCEELGVKPPTIYWHVHDKAALLDMLIEQITARFVDPGPAAGSAWDRLRGFFISVHDEIANYPGLAAFFARMRPRGPGVVASGAIVASLVADGVPEDDAIRAFGTVMVYVGGYLLYADAMLASETSDGETRAAARRPLQPTLQEFGRAVEDVPELEAFRRYTAAFDDRAAQEQFVWGLDRLLAGLQTNIGIGRR